MEDIQNEAEVRKMRIRTVMGVVNFILINDNNKAGSKFKLYSFYWNS